MVPVCGRNGGVLLWLEAECRRRGSAGVSDMPTLQCINIFIESLHKSWYLLGCTIEDSYGEGTYKFTKEVSEPEV